MFNIPLFQIEKFVFVLVRVSAILFTAPVLNSGVIPVQLKVGLALFLTVAMLPSAAVTPSNFPNSLPALALGLGAEVLMGAVIGLMMSLAMATVQVMGNLVGFQMGFGIVSVLDPSTAQQENVLATFFSMFGVLIFLVTNSHHLIFRAMAESFHSVAPFGFSASPSLIEILTRTFQNVFVVALKMGAPLLAILLFTYTALGIISKTVPQFNVFVAGFPLTICIGLLSIGLALPYVAVLARGTFEELARNILALLGAM